MRRATFLPSARRDFIDIHTYIVDASGAIGVGERFIKKIRTKCHKLAAIEGVIGRARPDLRPDIRSFPFENYLIFFRYNDKRFEVVNIIEGHRDIEALFSRDHRPSE